MRRHIGLVFSHYLALKSKAICCKGSKICSRLINTKYSNGERSSGTRRNDDEKLKFADKTGSITLSSETLQVKERKICVIIAKGVVNHLADFDFQDILAIIKTGFVYYKLNS